MSISIKNIISVTFSVVNIAAALPFCFIIAEYYEIFFTGYTGYLQFHSIPFDVAIILFSLSAVIISLRVIIKYFRHKPVPIIAPIVIIILYMTLYISSFFLG